MAKRKRKVASYARELLNKAREAMLSAVQIYNNPQVSFKSELFIVTTVIAWTYLLHAYYRKTGVEYRQTDLKWKGRRKKYLYTAHGAARHWNLEECLKHERCPVDKAIVNNLMFLIGIRHEIEHQMTRKIDEQMSAKFMAAALNFNAVIKRLFDKKHGLEKEQAFSIQFSSIDETTAKTLMEDIDLPSHIKSFVAQFESGMSQDEFNDPRFSYRIALVKKTSNNKNTADRMVQIVPAGSETASALNEIILKETERRKYRPSNIVKQMQAEGYTRFGMKQHTDLWKAKDGRNPELHYGADVEGTWFWYESWMSEARRHCVSHEARYKLPASIFVEQQSADGRA